MKGLYNPFTGCGRIKRALAAALFVAGCIVPVLSSQAAAAGSTSITFNPSSGSFDINTQFTVTIYENSGTTSVSGAEADFTYDQAKLQFLSIDASSSAFDLQGSNTGGSGSVSIARAKSGAGVTGSQVIAKVSFKAIVGSGSAVLKLVNTSDVQDSNTAASVWDGSLNSATYNLTTPTPTPNTPPPTTTPPTTPSTSTPSTSTPKTSTTTPKTSTSTPSTSTSNSTPTTPVTSAPNPSTTTPGTSDPSTASPPTKVQNNSFAKTAFIGAGAIVVIAAGLGMVRFIYARQQEARILANYYRTPGAPTQDQYRSAAAARAYEAQAQGNMPPPSTVVQPMPQANQPGGQVNPSQDYPQQGPPGNLPL